MLILGRVPGPCRTGHSAQGYSVYLARVQEGKVRTENARFRGWGLELGIKDYDKDLGLIYGLKGQPKLQ